MPTQPYLLKDGKRVPSVTTILHSWHPGGIEGLLGWANRLGREGKSHTEERDKAADAGTMCHAAAEAWAKGESYVFEGPDEIVTKAKRSFDAFLSWAGQTRFRITHTETPLVSEQYRFGGTMDAAVYNNGRVLVDYKTSNSIRANYLAQLGGGYRILWEEHFPEDPPSGFLILRFDREHGDFHQHFYPELDTAKKAFLALRDLYEYGKELTRRAA